MRIRTKSRLFVGAAIICVSQGSAVFAQSAPQTAEAPSDANEIIVTANKREENLNKVGLTITAIGGEALKERGISSLEDIAAVIPGLAYSSSTTNTPIFTLRGIGFQESSLGVYPAVSVYLDQSPLAFPILAAHSAYDLERIEVLKGPQGTLFGQNSTGGAINYIAAKPTKEWSAGGDISFGRFNTIEGNGFVSGPLGERAGMRLAVNGLNSDDWQKSISRPGDTNGHKSYVAGRLLVDIEPTESIKLQFNANGWRDKSQPQAQQLVGINPQTPTGVEAISRIIASPFSPNNARAADWTGTVIDPGTGVILTPEAFGGAAGNGIGGYVAGTGSLVNFEPFSDRKMWQLGMRADVELGGGITLTSLTSYTDFDQQQRVDQDGNALVTFDIQKADGYIKTFNQELRLANDAKSQFRWLLGANYEDSTTFEDQLLRYFDNSSHTRSLNWINASGVTNRQDIKNYAMFGNIEYDVSEQLTLKVAARYTNSKNDSSICSYTTPTGRVETLFGGAGINGTCFTFTQAFTNGPPISGTLKEDNVSWRVGADYKVSRDVLLYANVSRGYKAGSYPSLSTASYLGLLPVTQESVTAYEGGFKASLADRKIQLNAAAFYYDYRDKQIRGKLIDNVFGALDALINVPKSRIYGLEADITARPVDGLTINAAVTYLNSKITEGPGVPKNNNIYGQVDNPAGDPLPFTPKFSGVINVDYRREMASGGSAFMGVSFNARSHSDAAIGANRIPYPTGPNSFTAPGVGGNVFNIKGYTTTDARVGYEAADGAWKVMLWGKNIFNTYYWTTVIPSNDSQGRFAGMPATYGITLGFKID
ncbi:TonB-dependent receptor [Novosphingobium sp.]|uniref:TonB-dependent receptor n=1 Tax=Novosphingobium sp. TaxID=1874826 RepID=UPI00262ABB6F|nr:TonB-dependent receptor [Novosphingobium sp.]